MIRTLLIALLAIGCAGISNMAGDDTTNDAPTGCSVSLVYPTMAVAAPETKLQVSAMVGGAAGVVDFTWTVTFNGAPVAFQYPISTIKDTITFPIPNAGPYHVTVAVTGALCPTAQADVPVGVPGGALSQVRVRVFPASTDAPPQERLTQIPAGANFPLNDVTVYAGVMATGTTNVAAYLRFTPLGAPGTYVETYSAAGPNGKFEVRVLNENHEVLIVPIVPGYAPQRVSPWSWGMALPPLTAGTTLSGVVIGPDLAPIANAHVQIELDGVPSTLDTTDSSGAFSVLATVPPGSPIVRVTVTPPPASGLPRIVGGSDSLVTTGAIRVEYNPALVVRDVGGAVVRRGGAAQPNVVVKLVGTIGAVAKIKAGATEDANGEVRIATQTTGAGALPAGTLAPAVPLSAVSTIAGGRAVGAFDLTSNVPQTIDAPVPVQIDTQLRSPTQVPLPNAVIELVPSGALALAGAPVFRATADSSGNVSVLVPAGGRFDVRASDPLGRAAPHAVTDVPTAGLAASYALQPAMHVTGTLKLSGNPQAVRGTVQILCTVCTGIDRERPLAEGATTAAGAFDVAIFDPGKVP